MAIDTRAHSPERIVAPAPLPHISRKALKRVKNPLPAPTVCRYCGGDVELVCNSQIYNGRSYGEWPYAYLCSDCKAYVGLHPSTDIPLGTLAANQLRKDRNASKDLFHQLKELRGFSRNQAYQWLSERMGVPVSECHFGWFEPEQCAAASSICSAALNESTAMGRAFAKARR
ncbi:zinc-finger-containing protein [Pseudomonas sp. G.S.17]|uniref:zinc-finger-containing protein n=1 Tax=Pseudomonas sp. G.S.17 TaxID=3137451 RepID=UPI00311CA4C1